MTPTSDSSTAKLERRILTGEVEDFLYYEALLLDERRLTEWLDLLAEDLHYWMPLRRNIKFGDWDLEFSNPETEISYFDEGKDILEGRVRQINTGVHWAEEPVSRFSHLITNVFLQDASDQGANPGRDSNPENLILVSSKFFVYQNRLQDEVNMFVGRRYDELRRDPEIGFKVVKRTIILDQNVLLPKVVNTFF